MLKKFCILWLIAFSSFTDARLDENLYSGFSKTKGVVAKSLKKEHRTKTAKALCWGCVSALCMGLSAANVFILKETISHRISEKHQSTPSVFLGQEATFENKLTSSTNKQIIAMCVTTAGSVLGTIAAYKAMKVSYSYLKETQKD